MVRIMKQNCSTMIYDTTNETTTMMRVRKKNSLCSSFLSFFHTASGWLLCIARLAQSRAVELMLNGFVAWGIVCQCVNGIVAIGSFSIEHFLVIGYAILLLPLSACSLYSTKHSYLYEYCTIVQSTRLDIVRKI